MSKALQEQIDQLFEATKDLKSLEEIKPHCLSFNEWVSQQSYSEKSLGTLFSRYGLYSKFRKVDLKQGENAELIPKYDGDGKIKGHELKHYVPLYCGLDNKQWNDRNQSTRAIDRLENSTELDPDTYLEVTGKLLESEDPHELAVGIIAATGRRPHEVIARAKFYPVEGKPYHAMFEGQGKKRGEKPKFEIATLYPAEYVIKCLAKLRREPSTKSLLKEVATQFPKSLTSQNLEIDKRRNGSLNRVVRAYFGDKGDKSPILAFRHGEVQDNNKALRAAYAVLATERDCQGSFGAKILHASRLLGHFVKEIKNDRDLTNLGTSAGYSDYFTAKPVPFPLAPQKEKVMQVRVTDEDFETLKQLQKDWEAPNQQSVVNRLLESQGKLVELAKQLLEAKARINQLDKEKEEMSQVETQQVTVSKSELEAMIERMVTQKIEQALSNLPVTQQVNQANQSKPTTQAIAKPQEVIDWAGMSNADLWATKVKGASEEKIRRSYEAICLYNGTVATGDDDRLAITNQALRELSGVNGLLVGDWIKSHADEVISHNSKYGMQPVDEAGNPARDKNTGEIRTDSYYNKRHGKEKITKILGLINEQFLDGEALKSKNKGELCE
jgi:hypothetical protein